MSVKHSCVRQVQKTVSTKFTRETKENVQKMSVNQAHSVNEGKLDGTSVNRAHLVTKGSCGCALLTEFAWTTKEDHFRISVFQSGLANEEFSYFGLN